MALRKRQNEFWLFGATMKCVRQVDAAGFWKEGVDAMIDKLVGDARRMFCR